MDNQLAMHCTQKSVQWIGSIHNVAQFYCFTTTWLLCMHGCVHDKQPEIHCICVVQGFAESLQQDSSNQSEIVMIKLYCCGPDYCSIYPLLYYFFQIRHGLGSLLCCKDSAKPCTVLCKLVKLVVHVQS